jgi:hypothetical protein
MGRKRLNKTYKQILEESNIRSKRYYDLHKEDVKKKRMLRYWEVKLNTP